MKRIFIGLLAIVLIATGCTAQQSSENMSSHKDSTAYALGVIIAANAKQMIGDENVNASTISTAINDVFSKKEDKIKDMSLYMMSAQIGSEVYNGIDSTFDVAMILAGVNEALKDNEVIKAENANQYIMDYISNQGTEKQNAYLAEVAKIEGIQKTENGIFYKIENQGEGTIASTDKVSVKYTLYDYEDNEIDASQDQPFEVQLPSGVVPGFAQAIQLVGIGGKLTVWIPAELGYGERGAGRSIGPNQALKFDIEVIEKLQPDKEETKK